MTKLMPFADDAASVSIGKLTIENGTDRIALYGSPARSTSRMTSRGWRTRVP